MGGKKRRVQRLGPPVANIGDQLRIGHYTTAIEEIDYDEEFDEYIYWFYNDIGEYIYASADFVLGVKQGRYE
jgi:hypothetical protein